MNLLKYNKDKKTDTAELDWKLIESISNVINLVKKLLHFEEKHEKYIKQNKLELDLSSDFEKSIENWWVYLTFQWIFDSNWNVKKYEILTRVNSDLKVDWKTINIRQYIDAINKMWRTDLLSKLMIKTVNEIKNINNNWLDVNFSINLEYLNIIDENLISLLENTKFNNEITLELIEWKWYDDVIVHTNIKRLKKAWYKIAIDDYWVWESSTARTLKLFENGILDYVKIDWEIVKRLKSNDFRITESAEITIEYLVSLCKVWWAKTIAEYVEDRDLLASLQDLWVNLFQWWYFSEPKTYDEIKNEKIK